MDTITTAPDAAQGQHRWLPLDQLRASPLNHRKTFPKDKMAELAESIRAKGVIQPIIARPLDVGFEVVAGERRFRAAKDAGLEHLPAIVRTLTDVEVLELQVIENGQREDPHPLEEAEGYEALLKCQHPNGDRYTADEIAAKVAKSRSYVFARLKLLALCPEGRKAFYAGELDASKALLIARIGHHDTQRQALKDVTHGRYGNGEAMSYREAHRHILENYMLQLKAAPFDITDEKLVAKAGACGPCPKRTGNQADLFGDVKSADVCTDPRCFDDKRQAHYGVAAKALEADGFTVIAGAAAKKILPQWEDHRPGYTYFSISNGYVKFDSSQWIGSRNVEVSSLFEKDFKPTKLQHPLTGEIFDVVTQDQVTRAARKAPKAKAKGPGGATRQHREPERKPEDIFRERLYAEILRKIPSEPGKYELQLVAKDMVDTCDGADEIVADFFTPLKDGKKHDFTSGIKALKDAIPKMATADLMRLIVAVVAGREVSDSWRPPKDLIEIAKHYKLDPAKVKKQIADEAKAAAAKEAEAKAAAKKKPAKGLGAAGKKQVAKAGLKPVITPLLKKPASKAAKK